MSELKPCQKRAIDILWAEVCSNQQPLHCTRKELTDAVQMAEDAIRRAQPANEPLTLDELRGMDGEPVWIVFDDDSATWALVDAGHVAEKLKLTTNWGGQIVLVEHKAHIKAIYRCKPEERDTP